MSKASEISSSRNVTVANRLMSVTWSTSRAGPAARAAMSGNSWATHRGNFVVEPGLAPSPPAAATLAAEEPRLAASLPERQDAIILSNATILPHAAFGSGPDDGGAGFGAHGHAAGHPRARGDHPKTRGHESARSRTRGR